MSASRLRLNPKKTEVVWLGASQQISCINISDISILSTTIKVAESARDLGVSLDPELTMSAHVTALCRSGFFQLRQLHPFIRSLITEAAKTLVPSVIRKQYWRWHTGPRAQTLLACCQSLMEVTGRLPERLSTRQSRHSTICANKILLSEGTVMWQPIKSYAVVVSTDCVFLGGKSSVTRANVLDFWTGANTVPPFTNLPVPHDTDSALKLYFELVKHVWFVYVLWCLSLLWQKKRLHFQTYRKNWAWR